MKVFDIIKIIYEVHKDRVSPDAFVGVMLSTIRTCYKLLTDHDVEDDINHRERTLSLDPDVVRRELSPRNITLRTYLTRQPNVLILLRGDSYCLYFITTDYMEGHIFMKNVYFDDSLQSLMICSTVPKKI